MSITVPANSRGPILDLTLPASEDAIDIVLRNQTTGKQLTINLPAEWDGDDLTLDFYRRTIKDQTGADRSALLDAEDNELWVPEPLAGGPNEIELEALGAVVVVDAFNQSEGNATGKDAETGGTYEAVPGSDTTDFTVAGGKLKRTATSDTGSLGSAGWKGRGVGVGQTFSDLEISNDFMLFGGGAVRTGHIVSYVGNLEFIMVVLIQGAGDAWKVHAINALGETLGTSATIPELGSSPGDADGTILTRISGTSITVLINDVEYLTATNVMAGASGKAYIYDENAVAGANTRQYDNVAIRELGPYALSAQLRWERGYF